jgi:hypothetical protein
MKITKKSLLCITDSDSIKSMRMDTFGKQLTYDMIFLLDNRIGFARIGGIERSVWVKMMVTSLL